MNTVTCDNCEQLLEFNDKNNNRIQIFVPADGELIPKLFDLCQHCSILLVDLIECKDLVIL